MHREIQAIFLLLTRRADVTRVLFAVLFFPGVLLHESSHYLMARLLRVPTGRFSLIPRQINEKRLQLGAVETVKTDLLRDSLIGASPLLAGGAFVAYVGLVQYRLLGFWELTPITNRLPWIQEIITAIHVPDFWLWLYLVFVVSSTMLPTSSDRRAWLPVFIILGALVLSSIFAGAGPWFLNHLAPGLNRFFRSLAFIFGLSSSVHLAILIPLLVMRLLLERLLRMKAV